MAEAKQTSYEHFLRRYERLKADYFSPNSTRIEIDEDTGEPLPSCFPTQAQLAKTFTEELKVHIPTHRQDPPRFLDGSVGPGVVHARPPAPPARPLHSVQESVSTSSVEVLPANPNRRETVYTSNELVGRDDRRHPVSLKPKAKQIHCGLHGKVLAIMMDDDVLMCETCYKSNESVSEPELSNDGDDSGFLPRDN